MEANVKQVERKLDVLEVERALWNVANKLRGSMDANEFKDYILPMMFIKFLSTKCDEVETRKIKQLLETGVTEDKIEYYGEQIKGLVKREIYYYIPKEYRYDELVRNADIVLNTDNPANISILETLDTFIVELTKSTQNNETSEHYFKDLFQAMSTTNVKLGINDKIRNNTLAKLILEIDNILPYVDVEGDIMGTAYEYLLANFASNAGKKAGEFYTPSKVSELLAMLVTSDNRQIGKIYDPTCGSGSLLLHVADHVTKKQGKELNDLMFYGQELNATTYNLAKMNMLLHNVPIDSVKLEVGNTLEDPKHIGTLGQQEYFDTIVANPPYSADWDYTKADYQNRFDSGKAPKTKADFAFIQHMLYHLDDNGMAVVVLPHGVLFRGSQEGKIRQHLLENNLIDAIIGLPANLFYGTSIPTCIVVLKKDRVNEDILFIDASNEFTKMKSQNELSEENLNKIVTTFVDRKEIEKYSKLVTIEEVRENEYNLNIPRYVDTTEEEEIIDLTKVDNEIALVDKEIEALEKELEVYYKELGLM